MSQRLFPPLYGLSSRGRVKVWAIHAEALPDDTAATVVTHGYEGGVMQTSRTLYVEGKNLGRANETTPFEQAQSEAQSKWERQLDRGYRDDKRLLSVELRPRPMLAHDYAKRGSAIEFPAFVQPKLNGIRCLAQRTRDGVRFWSRAGKEFTTLGHLVSDLIKCLGVGDVLDGELYNHDMSFQEITSAVKREQDATARIQYHAYDVVKPVKFCDRLLWLDSCVAPERSSRLVVVPTLRAEDRDHVLIHHTAFVHDGFEGTIIRNAQGKYKGGYRSPDLQKLKDFLEEEFEIIGGSEARGKDVGTVTFRCRTHEGKEFDVRPRGSREQRAQWLSDLERLVGGLLTVRFQNYSDEGVPIFPVGVNVRDYE